jgi:segregation and condensation protein B
VTEEASDERDGLAPSSLAARAAAWVPPWERTRENSGGTQQEPPSEVEPASSTSPEPPAGPEAEPQSPEPQSPEPPVVSAESWADAAARALRPDPNPALPPEAAPADERLTGEFSEETAESDRSPDLVEEPAEAAAEVDAELAPLESVAAPVDEGLTGELSEEAAESDRSLDPVEGSTDAELAPPDEDLTGELSEEAAESDRSLDPVEGSTDAELAPPDEDLTGELSEEIPGTDRPLDSVGEPAEAELAPPDEGLTGGLSEEAPETDRSLDPAEAEDGAELVPSESVAEPVGEGLTGELSEEIPGTDRSSLDSADHDVPADPDALDVSGELGEGGQLPLDIALPEGADLGAPGRTPENEPAVPALPPAELRAALEAILLVVDEPVTELLLAQVLEQATERVATALADLGEEYTVSRRGFDLRRAAGGWRLYTRPEYAAYVERFVLDGQSVRLTQAALETLAVIAYKQPVTRSRISAIRGVNCDGVVRTLITRGLIEECGTEPESGAHLYRTSSLFLEKLGLDSVDQLPPLAPFLPDNVDEIADDGQR